MRGSVTRIGPHRFEANVDRTECLRSSYPAGTILIERIATDGRYLRLRSNNERLTAQREYTEQSRTRRV